MNFAAQFITFAGSFRVSLFIDLECLSDLGKHSGSFMITRWPISWFIYRWHYVHTIIILISFQWKCSLPIRHVDTNCNEFDSRWSPIGWIKFHSDFSSKPLLTNDFSFNHKISTTSMCVKSLSLSLKTFHTFGQ